MQSTDNLYVFAEEDSLSNNEISSSWKILIVDDDKSFHHFMADIFADFKFEQKEIKFLNAYSIEEALALVKENTELTVIIIDMMIEKTVLGFEFIKHIREKLNNHSTQVIISTGNKIDTSLKKTMYNYDINDYLEKTELNPRNIHSIIVMALRSYTHSQEMEKSKQDLKEIAIAAGRFVPRMFLKILNKKNIVDIKPADHIEKELTILFLDIRSFTSLSEFATPRETFNFINDCLSYLQPYIAQNNGFIDKHIGDAIMSLFPGKADDSINAAIAMLKTLEDYNYSRIIKNEIPIKIGVGINTGLVMLGMVGYHDRTDCTVIGDAVNVAERVEKCNKTFGSNIIISEQTLFELMDPNQFHYRSLGKVNVPGKKQLQPIFEVYNADTNFMIAKKDETKNKFEEAVRLYYIGETLEASNLFNEIFRINPYDMATKYFLETTTHFLEKNAK